MQLDITSDDEATEPFMAETRRGSVAKRKVAPTSSNRVAWLKRARLGRAMLGAANWAVVAALVVSGYFAAAAINFGIDYASRDTAGKPNAPGPILASSVHK